MEITRKQLVVAFKKWDDEVLKVGEDFDFDYDGTFEYAEGQADYLIKLLDEATK